MSTSRLSNLLFLSGLAAVAMPGCDSESGETEAGSSATDGGTTDGSTGAGESTSPGGSTSAGGSSESGATTPTGDPETTTGETAGGDGVCAAFAMQSAACDRNTDYGYELNFCNGLLATIAADYSQDCYDAYEEVLVCASGLECAEFNAEETPPACQDAEDKLNEVCDFPTGGSSGGTDSAGSSGG